MQKGTQRGTFGRIVLAIIILLLGTGIALFDFKSEPKLNKYLGALSSEFETQRAFFKNSPFRLGLDLSGGSHLIYKADVSAIKASDVSDSMDALRDVIERRVNLFGVSEPQVTVEGSGFISGGENMVVSFIA